MTDQIPRLRTGGQFQLELPQDLLIGNPKQLTNKRLKLYEAEIHRLLLYSV